MFQVDYPWGMKALLELQPRDWTLLVLPPRHMRATLLAAIGQLAALGSITILDGGNQTNVHIIARAVQYRPELLGRVYIARVFTCYQMLSALENMPSSTQPVLILSFLATLYDENVALAERKYILERCLEQIKRLSRGSGLAVTVTPPPDLSDSLCLFERTQTAAKKVLVYEIPALPEIQPRLFQDG